MTDPLQDPGVQGLAQLGRNAIERVAQLEHWLGNLLAVIHRDGGHYESEHGTEKACADAETAVHVLRGSLEGYVEANRHMKGELDDALEDARRFAEAQREIDVLSEANGHQDQMICDQAAEIERLHSGAVDMLNWKDRTIADYKSERDEAQAEIARLRDALSAVFQYGSDTLSGPVGEPDDRKWQRAGVLEMTRRARAALAQVAEVPK